MMSAIRCVSTIAVAVLAVPGQAQDGATPEKAQKFIEIVLKQGATRATVRDVQIERSMDQGWNCNGMSVCAYTQSMDGSLSWMSAPSTCTTNVGASIGNTSWRGDHSMHYVKEHPQTQINWATISKAQLPEGGTSIELKGSGRLMYIHMATPELAGRMKKAFDTLITACDPTAGTGF